MSEKTKIYGFVNGGSPGWYSVEALSEEGLFLAGHVCSHPCYGPHDIGVTSNWKHDTYAKFYPEGFEVIWCEDAKDPRLLAAHAKHVAMSVEDYKARMTAAGYPPTEENEVHPDEPAVATPLE